MKKKYLIGLDAGTTCIKAVLFDFEGHELFISSVDNEVIKLNRTWNEQDMEQLWRNLKACLKDLTAKSGIDPEEVAGIGLSAQGEGLWTLDKDGVPVRNAMLWNDGRAADLIGMLKSEHEDLYNRIKLENATYIKPGSTLTLIRWFKENEPELYAKTKTIFTCKDFVRYRMTGNLNWEMTDASCSCLDMANKCYSEDIFELMGVKDVIEKLPPLMGATDKGGELKEEVAREVGLCPGTPVSGGMLDIVATAAGAGAVKENSVCTILGTTGMNFITLSEYVADLAINGWEMHMEHGKLIKGQGMMSAMPNQNWLLQELFGEEKLTGEVFARINEKVSGMKPGEGGLLYLPHIDPSGERAPFFNPDACAQIMGIKTTTTKYEVLHAVMEGVCLGIRDCLSFATGKLPIYLTGGGAKSEVWRQMIADVTGREVMISDSTELAAKGAAMSAGIMAGVFKAGEDAEKFCNIKCIVSPREEYTLRYDELYKAYKKAQENAADFWKWRTSFLRGT